MRPFKFCVHLFVLHVLLMHFMSCVHVCVHTYVCTLFSAISNRIAKPIRKYHFYGLVSNKLLFIYLIKLLAQNFTDGTICMFSIQFSLLRAISKQR